MVFQSGTQNQQTRDEIGSEPEITEIVKVKSDLVQIPPITRVSQQVTIGESWIVGSSTNGIVGTNTGTQGGGQQVVGGSGRTTTVQKVINTNNTYFDLLDTTQFKDSATADWTGNGIITMTNTEVATSLDCYKDTTNLSTATITVTLSAGVIGDLALQMSANGGSDFENATNKTLLTFSNAGNQLRWKLTASGNVTVSRVEITYNLVGG